MRPHLHPTEPLIVDGQRLIGASLVHIGHLAALQHPQAATVGIGEQHLFIVAGELAILLSQRLLMGVERQLAVEVVVGVAEGGTPRTVERSAVYPLQGVVSLVVHARVAILKRHLRKTLAHESRTASLSCKFHAAADVAQCRVVAEGEVLFVEFVSQSEACARFSGGGKLLLQVVDVLLLLRDILRRELDGAIKLGEFRV